MKFRPNNKNNGKQKELCSKTRTILSANRYKQAEEKKQRQNDNEIFAA
jgi:hypothetical protein